MPVRHVFIPSLKSQNTVSDRRSRLILFEPKTGLKIVHNFNVRRTSDTD